MYSARQTQASGASAGPPQEPTNSTRPPMAGMTTLLPNRQRDATNIDSVHGPPGDSTANTFLQSFQASGETMDFSPDLNLGERNPPSDHPTPSTMNSSSNTSYSLSGGDNSSPGKTQKSTHGVTPSFGRVHPVHISPTKTDSPPMPDASILSGQTYPNTTTASLGVTGTPPAFSIPSAWDMPTANPDMSSSVDYGNINVNSFSEAQWDQLLSDAGNVASWENWRPS